MGPRPHPRRLRPAARRRPSPAASAPLGDRHRHRRARSASRPPSPALVGHKPTYGSVVPLRADRLLLAASTRPARWPARSSTPRCCTRRSAATTRCDSTSIDAPAAGAGRVRPPRRRRRPVRPARSASSGSWAARATRRLARASWPASTRRSRLLGALGAEVPEVSCPRFDLRARRLLPDRAERGSSNLARFDGVRYGLRVGDDGSRDLDEVMALTREQGFGAEVKRRIILGTYALSSGYYEAYYGQAQKVRTLISRDFAAAFEQVDVLVSPTTPTVGLPARRPGRRPDRHVRRRPVHAPASLRRRPGACRLPSGLPSVPDEAGLPTTALPGAAAPGASAGRPLLPRSRRGALKAPARRRVSGRARCSDRARLHRLGVLTGWSR